MVQRYDSDSEYIQSERGKPADPEFFLNWLNRYSPKESDFPAVNRALRAAAEDHANGRDEISPETFRTLKAAFDRYAGTFQLIPSPGGYVVKKPKKEVEVSPIVRVLLSWVMFAENRERFNYTIQRCQDCQGYILDRGRRPRKFCSDKCRMRTHWTQKRAAEAAKK